ncbi:MAG: CHASE2 domain-containing protein [Armatimonadota bacterium]
MSAPGSNLGRALSRAGWLRVATLAVALVAVVAAYTLQAQLHRGGNPLLLKVEGTAFDLGMTARAQNAGGGSVRPGPVTVVQISEDTFEQLSRVETPPGGLSWTDHPRAFHARVLDNLRRLGAKVIVFDLLFADEDAEADPRLAEAIRRHGRVILAVVEDRGNKKDLAQSTIDISYPEFSLYEASAGIGVVNVPLDSDKTVRSFWWAFPGIDYDTGEDTLIPTLGVAAAAAYSGANPKTVMTEELAKTGTFLGRRPAKQPWDARRDASYIWFYGPRGAPAGPGTVIGYEDVYLAFEPERAAEREILAERLKDRIVLIGDATKVKQDFHRVPVRSSEEDGFQMPGVELQAHITQTALQGLPPSNAPEWLRVLLLAGVCLLLALVGRALSPVPLVAAGAGAIGLLWWGTPRLLADFGVWLEPVTATVGVLIVVPAQSVVMYFGERKEQLRVRRVLSRHVGPGVADKLSEWPELGGETREITMLFSDLQGFTTLSETMSSQEICELLNRYFAVMFPILFKHGGTMDKLMGDGMMAYFGFPDRQPDHAARAVRCAIEMEEVLNAWQRTPEMRGKPPLKTRIGIHSGPATVGEIGQGERAEFTVIGDVVNVASRLEGMNKEFGTTILISEATKQAAGDLAPTVSRGTAVVRGRKEPMPVYSIELARPQAGGGAPPGEAGRDRAAASVPGPDCAPAGADRNAVGKEHQ